MKGMAIFRDIAKAPIAIASVAAVQSGPKRRSESRNGDSTVETRLQTAHFFLPGVGSMCVV